MMVNPVGLDLSCAVQGLEATSHVFHLFLLFLWSLPHVLLTFTQEGEVGVQVDWLPSA